MSAVVVAALYKFVHLPDYVALQQPLMTYCREQGIKGTLLLAEEGINGTISGTRTGIDNVLNWLKQDPRFADLEHKESYFTEQPFYRLKIKLKKEIVTLGVPGVDPNSLVGTYVAPRDWNALISDPDVILVDTRNDYEYDIGTFKGALNPNTVSFREFPQYVKDNLDPARHKKVAMFCTGGIRCEKSTSYLKSQGFDEVYHLHGGILKYLEEVPEEESLWEGECFVFDSRVAVNHKLAKGQYDQCYGCRHPVTAEDKQSDKYMQGVSCPRCFDKLTPEQKERFTNRQKQCEIARSRQQQHVGATRSPRSASAG